MSADGPARRRVESARHRTAYLEMGPADGPLMIFIHGWPMLGLVWRRQLEHFSARGWRCIAPDMRGYGGSSVPTRIADYATQDMVGDMVELHDALGGAPAVWVGHDWGAPVVWALAAHHAERCVGVANLCIPYFARGFVLPHFIPLVDREMYPVDTYPIGQWDYWEFYRERFAEATRQLEADPDATIAALYRSGKPDAVGAPARTAGVRARGGWFGPNIPKMARDEDFLSQSDHDALVAAFTATGFRGANAWYLNDVANLDYAARAPRFGRLALPVLFLHAAWDMTCETLRSRFAEPMRADCTDLDEATIEGGHSLMLERPDEVARVLEDWLARKVLRPLT